MRIFSNFLHFSLSVWKQTLCDQSRFSPWFLFNVSDGFLSSNCLQTRLRVLQASCRCEEAQQEHQGASRGSGQGHLQPHREGINKRGEKKGFIYRIDTHYNVSNVTRLFFCCKGSAWGPADFHWANGASLNSPVIPLCCVTWVASSIISSLNYLNELAVRN